MDERSRGKKKRIPKESSTVLARIEEAHKHQLSALDLSGLYLTELPEPISQLTQLQELNLSGNLLTALPKEIGKLTKLFSLDLSDNQLSMLPDEIGQLTRLLFLSLSRNRLVELPNSFGQLRLLKYLFLSGNQLTLLECINQLTQLRSLSLWHNSLIELPASFGQLTQLDYLDIAGTQLTALPEWVSQLIQLKHLDLGDNQLATLPEWLGQLAQLEHLSVASNQLSELPISLTQLTRLKLLNLNNNRLTALPEWLRSLKSLKELYLHGNAALYLPEEVCGPRWHQVVSNGANPVDPADILEYYFRVRSGKRPLNEAKLILVGRGGVGKTSLVNRLVNNSFDKDEKKTEGIRIIEWPLRLVGNEDVRLNIWDFGGQEIMHATHQFFLTERSLYLLVLNGREGGEDVDAEYWLKLIESFGGESPVIVVLNKIKAHPFDLNRRGLQQKYPAIRDVIKTDCEDETGIDELHKVIERETDRLEHLRDPFPASWFTIKEQLASMKKNYVSFDEYRQFCQQHGEIEEAAQEALARYLHNLGIALNYADDPRLLDTHVLNPRWVTNGIYRILNSNQLAEQKGEIRLHDLAVILDADYPANMRRFLFDLMKKFDLCFSFPDDDAHYLIPELLDKEEPQETAEFEPDQCLNFQYQYPILPEGLLPRFIVRTHVLSEGLPRWRTGVILRFEDNRALVKADVQDHKVFISVTGPALGRRQLLAIIRSDFERIHRDISNLQPQEMVPVPGYPRLVEPYKKLQVMEQRGVRHFTDVVDDDVVEFDVHELLNGVDFGETRKKDKIMDIERQSVRLFYSYSHKDEKLRDELEIHLKLLQRQGLIDTWHDRKIEAGDEWKQQIDDNLERADVILLLISAHFIASDYCYEKEMKRALERHEKGEARVIPVIVRDTNWRIAPFSKLQALPKDGKAVTSWTKKDTAWRNVSEGIQRVVEEMRKNMS